MASAPVASSSHATETCSSTYDEDSDNDTCPNSDIDSDREVELGVLAGECKERGSPVVPRDDGMQPEAFDLYVLSPAEGGTVDASPGSSSQREAPKARPSYRFGNPVAAHPRVCGHGLNPKVWLVQKDTHDPGRKVLRCPLDIGHQCRYFEWVDEPAELGAHDPKETAKCVPIVKCAHRACDRQQSSTPHVYLCDECAKCKNAWSTQCEHCSRLGEPGWSFAGGEPKELKFLRGPRASGAADQPKANIVGLSTGTYSGEPSVDSKWDPEWDIIETGKISLFCGPKPVGYIDIGDRGLPGLVLFTPNKKAVGGELE